MHASMRRLGHTHSGIWTNESRVAGNHVGLDHCRIRTVVSLQRGPSTKLQNFSIKVLSRIASAEFLSRRRKAGGRACLLAGETAVRSCGRRRRAVSALSAGHHLPVGADVAEGTVDAGRRRRNNFNDRP